MAMSAASGDTARRVIDGVVRMTRRAGRLSCADSISSEVLAAARTHATPLIRVPKALRGPE